MRFALAFLSAHVVSQMAMAEDSQFAYVDKVYRDYLNIKEVSITSQVEPSVGVNALPTETDPGCLENSRDLAADMTPSPKPFPMPSPTPSPTPSPGQTPGPKPLPKPLPLPSPNPKGIDDPVDISQIITLGDKIWAIIKANQPVVTSNFKAAHALPIGVTCVRSLDNWKAPKSILYNMVYKNYFGMTVIDFSFRAMFNYGGQWKGAGQYLSNVTVVPDTIRVAWGYTFDANAVPQAAVNTGTNENPVAGLQVDVNWTIKNAMSYLNKTKSVFVSGDGSFKDLQQP